MDYSDPNLHIVEIIASHLGELCSDVVFVGGCAAGMLLTEMRSQSIRMLVSTRNRDCTGHGIAKWEVDSPDCRTCFYCHEVRGHEEQR